MDLLDQTYTCLHISGKGLSGLDSTKNEDVLLFVCSKVTEFIPVKLETTRSVKLTLIRLVYVFLTKATFFFSLSLFFFLSFVRHKQANKRVVKSRSKMFLMFTLPHNLSLSLKPFKRILLCRYLISNHNFTDVETFFIFCSE